MQGNYSLMNSLINETYTLFLSKLPEALLELNVVWDQIHLMITKATTPDLIKMYYKLIDFFEKQLNEGKDYIKDFDLFYDSKVKQQCNYNLNYFISNQIQGN